MRAVACALAALSIAAGIPLPAAGQSSYGPPSDSYQSGTPPYFTDRAPPRAPDQGFDRPPPQRGERSSPWPPAGRVTGPHPQQPRERVQESRPRPPVENSRPPVTTYRRVEPGPGPGPGDPPPEERVDRRIVTSPPSRGPSPRERYEDGAEGPGSRVMIGPNEIVISIAEYEDLRNQARELQRLRGTRSDDRDYRPGSGPTYR